MRVRAAFGVALACVWALDVVTKVWAAADLRDEPIAVFGGRLLLRESRNTGAAFSIGTGSTVPITLIGIIVVAAILRYVRRVTSRVSAVGLGLIAGGALGNLTDRFFRSPGPLRGGVVDWLDLGWFPSFNAADSAITVGVALLLLSSYLEERRTDAAAA